MPPSPGGDPGQSPPPQQPPPLANRPPPPVISAAPIARPPRRGAGWKVLAIVLLGLFGVSFLFNLRHVARDLVKSSDSRTVGPRLEEVVIRDNTESANKIAVIDVDGVISGQNIDQTGYSMVTVIREQLRTAGRDKDVKAVILKVDSPGGEVLASDEISKAIRDFQDRANKPVVVSMGNLAASGGYYISAPCQWIVANELTITGSIGVIMHGYNYRGLLDKVGVQPEVFKSGKYKDMLSGTKEPSEVTPEEKQMVQGLINETFEKFKSVVADGRHAAYKANHQSGKPLSDDWEEYADGRILSGKEAYRLGFVDEIGDFDNAVERAKQLVNIKNAQLIQYQQSFDLSNLLRIFGKADAKTIKLDLGIDIPRLRAGYPYYLAPNYLH